MSAKKFIANEAYVKAAGLMLLSTLGFSSMSVLVRCIRELDPTLIVALRNALTLVLLFPFAVRHHGALIHTKRLRDHALRGCLGSVGMITWTYCLTIMPLAHATALSFTAPLFSAVFAISFLDEKASRARWIALFVGFLGTLVILRPSAEGFDWNSLLVMAATSAWAITGMFVKSLSRTEPPLRVVFYMNLFMFLMALPLALMHWQWPNSSQWFVLLGIACCSLIMHLSMVKAYSLAPVVTLLPLDFTRLIYTSILAWLVFGEGSDLLTWVGSAIIVASAALMARADAKAPPVA